MKKLCEIEIFAVGSQREENRKLKKRQTWKGDKNMHWTFEKETKRN